MSNENKQGNIPEGVYMQATEIVEKYKAAIAENERLTKLVQDWKDIADSNASANKEACETVYSLQKELERLKKFLSENLLPILKAAFDYGTLSARDTIPSKQAFQNFLDDHNIDSLKQTQP